MLRGLVAFLFWVAVLAVWFMGVEVATAWIVRWTQ